MCVCLWLGSGVKDANDGNGAYGRYRQIQATKYMQDISKERAAAGAPSFMDIITKPGWDKKVGDVYRVDEDWNIIPPETPELLGEGAGDVSLVSSQDSLSSRDEQSDSGGVEHDSEKASDRLAKASDRLAPDVYGIQAELEDADLADDAAGTLGILERLLNVDGSAQSVDVLLSHVQHASGKAQHSHTALSARIRQVASEVQLKWGEALRPAIEKQAALDTIVLPQPMLAKRNKSYSKMKERLREAGMPTGGKKRKILVRLKGCLNTLALCLASHVRCVVGCVCLGCHVRYVMCLNPACSCVLRVMCAVCYELCRVLVYMVWSGLLSVPSLVRLVFFVLLLIS